MLTKLEVFNPRIPESPLPLGSGSANTDPFQIMEIEGLGPVEAQISTKAYTVTDGEAVAGAHVGKRNVVITLALNANWINQRPAELRGLLNRYFMPKSQVSLRFHSTHLPLCEIDGIVETNEPNIFSKEPEVQISVLCPEPYFRSVQAQMKLGDVVAAPSLATDTIDYLGNVPAGFVLKILGGASSYNDDLEIAVFNPLEEQFLVKGELSTSKQVHLSTVDRDKYIRQYTAPSTVVSLLGQTDRASVWPKLWPGENGIVVRRTAGGSDLSWELHFYEYFGGL